MGTAEFETVTIQKTDKVCPMCEEYARREASKPVVVMACEGACLRGEIARQAANILCFELAPEKTTRLCLGGAFTKNTGQRALARHASKLVAIEGCFIECATRMMRAVVPDGTPQVVIADRHCEFDHSLFGINQMSETEIKQHAREVA